MFKTITNLWEYFFAPWEKTVLSRGSETWSSQTRKSGILIDKPWEYQRDYVEYKLVHKFRKEEKIVKEYLD